MSSQPTAPDVFLPAAPTLPRLADVFFDRFRKLKFFSCLDGLRAISIVAVIWHHTAAETVSAWSFLQRGNRGVTLFFAISAFLISTLLLRAKERVQIDVPRFWARRALRIMPLFYLVLAAYTGLVYFVEQDAAARSTFFENLPAFATFTSNWFVKLDDARVIFYFAWSLAAEEQFYLCWPWIERAFARAWPVVIAFGVLIASQCVGWHLAGAGDSAVALKIIASVPSAILFGVVLAHALHSPAVFRWLWTLAGRRGSAIGALVFAGFALSVEPALGFFGELVTSFALTLLVATCVIREDNDLAPVLKVRAIAWIGTVSYGIYLLHMLAVAVARRVLEQLGVVSPYGDFIGGTIVAVAAATLSYVTFERYFLRLKDRWFGDRSAAPRTPPSATPAPVAAGSVVPPVPPPAPGAARASSTAL